MIGFLGGAALGVAGMIAKDKFLGNDADNKLQAKQRELDNLYAENEKFRKRNKELEREVEDLLSKLQKVQRDAKDRHDDQDDLEDALADSRSEVKKLRQQNDELMKMVQEYKVACENYELEVQRLKDK